MPIASDRTFAEFLSEAQEILDTFNRTLLAIEDAAADRAPALINDCFRAIHSLKGLAGLVGLSHLARVTHSLESLLDALRLGRVPLEGAALDALFEAIDVLERGLAAASRSGDLPVEVADPYEARLRALCGGTGPAPGRAPAVQLELDPDLRAVLTEYEEHRLRDNLERGHMVYVVAERFDLATVDQGLEGLKAALQPLGEIISTVPGGGDDDSFETLQMRLVLASGRTPAELAAVLAGRSAEVITAGPSGPAPGPAPAPDRGSPAPAEGAAGDSAAAEAAPADSAAAEAAPAGAAAPPAAEPAAADGSVRSLSQSVRVDIRRLDALMNVAGELGLTHSNLSAFVERLEEGHSGPDARGLRRELRSLERKIGELQERILEVRMVPLRQVFDRLSRVVRKVARGADKAVRLEIGGEETELDKLMVEELSDPLLHVIRNAIDHGIEPAAERRAAGKPDTATVRVQALQQGNRVIITVTDDGRGIDAAAVREAALRRGLLGRAEVTDMSRRELLNLLFLPGMSTRQQATELSGRGVGLDVVKTNIGNLSGIIDLASTPGQGTTVTITVPVTLAIIQALVVAVAGRTYAVPLNGVVESLMIDPAEVRTVEGREVISVRQQTVRLARLDRFFELPRGSAPPADRPLYVVLVGVAEHRLGLVVDELVGQQDILIKSLGALLSGVRGIAGAAELGGSQTVLVLDVAAIVEEIGRGGPGEVAA